MFLIWGKTTMKTFATWCLAAGMALLSLAHLQAADEPKGKKKAEPGAQAFNLPKEITLSAEQQEKLAALKKELGPKVAAAQKKIDEILTADQKAARKAAQEKVKADNLKGKAAQEAVEAALKLTDEQKTKFTAAQAEMREVQALVKSKMAEFLTDEQKAKVPGLVPKKPKTKN